MGKNRVIEQNRCYHIGSRLAHRAFFLDDEKYVDDPKASDGRALKLFNTHFEWCSTFPMRQVAFEPGTTYKIRVRIRVDKLRDGGEAFWAGIYDPVAKRSRGGIQPRTEKVAAEYAWYDVCTWMPIEDEYFWIGPGRFGKDGNSSIKALWIDKLEFSRVSSGAVR